MKTVSEHGDAFTDIDEYEAYVTDDNNHCNYDWKIIEVRDGEIV